MSEVLDREELPVSEDECPCYKCSGEERKTDNSGNEYTANNMEYHTYDEPCEKCGTPRTKYWDLGRKGRFVCPNCR